MSACGPLEQLFAGGRLWLVSDIHANAVALRAFFSQIDADDAVVLMGDLLTYGCAPQATLELVEQCLQERASALLLGNHDALYRDLSGGRLEYYAQLPAWLRETVDWTARQIDARRFCELPWQNEIALGPVLVAHANPFGASDWTYLDSVDQYRRALNVCVERGFQLGVFGHVHRPRLLMRSGGMEHWNTQQVVDVRVERGSYAAWNVGSIGQQRCTQTTETVGCLRVVGAAIELTHHAISYDVAEHLAQIREANLSESTRERLIRYHQRAAT
jgi:predicted phosphodiesterase